MGTPTPNLFKALAETQKELEGASKNANNPHFRSKYADLGTVFEAFQAVGPKHGLCVIQCPCETDKPGILLETTLAHSSGESITSRLYMPASKADAQGYGSALTYARRYALSAIVGICPVDDDGNAATGKADGPKPVRKDPSHAEANRVKELLLKASESKSWETFVQAKSEIAAVSNDAFRDALARKAQELEETTTWNTTGEQLGKVANGILRATANTQNGMRGQ